MYEKFKSCLRFKNLNYFSEYLLASFKNASLKIINRNIANLFGFSKTRYEHQKVIKGKYQR